MAKGESQGFRMQQLNILHLENDQMDADLIRETLVSQGIIANIVRIETEDEFRTALKGGSVNVRLYRRRDC